MTPRRTMAIAQQLYEGVDIAGEGTVGLITYMRTDSLRISEEALAAAKDFILGRYGTDYYPGDDPPLQDQGRRAGRARGHPSLQRELHARSAVKGDLTRRAVPPLPAHLEPLPRQPDGERRL